MNLGNKIRELRLKNSITQEQLAQQMSVSAQCISKWENNVTMPDIQLLPEISVYFGVTIDELFNLTDDAHLNRIANMLSSERMLNESEFQRAEAFLKEKTEGEIKKGNYFTRLAELYNHMADGYRNKAEHCAKEALLLEPEKKYNHSLLRMAQQGTILDWNYANHYKRISFYQQFVKDHPSYARGYVWLLDELIADNRLVEAENVLSQMKMQCDNVRVPLYSGLVQWQKGEHELAQKSWNDMIERYPDDWLAHSCMADCMAKICNYEEAVQYYHNAMELQEKPRYTDSPVGIAHIYEIQGEYQKAIQAWEDVIYILQDEYHIIEGEGIDAPMREIERLKRTLHIGNER